jgi:two-component system CheB/CheR fusion protein
LDIDVIRADRSPPQPPSALCVLIVDDVPDAVESLALLVRLWGHRAVVACDGPAALRLARVERPDVVLLDLGLRGMDGCEVARRLRAEPGLAGALLVAVTGYADGSHRRLACEAGVELYLVKPVEPEALERVLATFRGSTAL